MAEPTTEVIIEMPRGAYGSVREQEFELLAGHLGLSPLKLRVILSNLFVTLARGLIR